MHLKGKTALVTGGSTGLGYAITEKLLKKGCKVTICAHTEPNLRKAEKTLNSPSLKAEVCDITDKKQVQDMTAKIKTLDILINCAGIWLEGPLEANTCKEISRTIDVNLKGLIYVTKTMLPKLKRSKRGLIVNISSTSGLTGKPQQSVYCASKFGVRGFTDALKAELSETNVRAIGIYPGGMKTPLFEKAGNKKALKDYMDPSNVAETIVHILERPENIVIDHIVINRGNKTHR